MLRACRYALVTALIGLIALLAVTGPATSAPECDAGVRAAPAGCPDAGLRVPGAGYSGPGRTASAPATVTGFRFTAAKRWEPHAIPAGTRLWVEPYSAAFSWTWSGATGWLTVQRTRLRTDDGSAALPVDQRTTVDLAAPYHADGRFLRDATGRVVFFHGVNMIWKRAPYVPPSTLFGASLARSALDSRDAELLAANGLNGVRLGVLWAGVEPTPTRYDASYLAHMRALASLLADRDVSVLVDSHQDMFGAAHGGEGFPDWASFATGTKVERAPFPAGYFTPSSLSAWNALWANRGQLQDRFAAQWTQVAAVMRDLPNLVGYDVVNEPFPGTSAARCVLPGGCRAFDSGPLQRMQERAITGIRVADTKAPVWWEGNMLTSAGGRNLVGASTPIRDSGANRVLSFHSYCVLGGVLPGLSRANDPTCAATHAGNFERARVAAARNRSASALTEFGSSDDVTDIARVAALADRSMTSWYYYHYAGWSDPTATGTGTTSLFSDDADRASLKPAKADALVRTYPQAVAGTPLSFDFAPQRSDRRFRLSFVLDPRITAETVIAVPVQRHYEGGYTVRVTGPATVTSAPDAPLLTLDGGRGRGAGGGGGDVVTVTLVRAGHVFG